MILAGLEGSSELICSGNRFALDLGQTLLRPAAAGPCTIDPRGEAVVLKCVVP
jgi:hypothetical protein